MKVELSNKIAELEALVSEREGMLAENQYRLACCKQIAYGEDAFADVASSLRSLKEESPSDSPASPVQHAQPAIAELMKSFFDSQYLSVDGRMAVEAFAEYVQQQQAGARKLPPCQIVRSAT